MPELEVMIREQVSDKMEALLTRIDGLDTEIAAELHAWQVEDMNRKYPETHQTSEGATTSVWPRSRTNTSRRRAIAYARAQLRKKGIKGPVGVRSNRPILRPMLVEKLRERMAELGKRTLSWQ